MPDGQATAREHESSVTLRYSYGDPCPHQCPASRRQIHPGPNADRSPHPPYGRSGIPAPGRGGEKGPAEGVRSSSENGSIGRFQATGSGLKAVATAQDSHRGIART